MFIISWRTIFKNYYLSYLSFLELFVCCIFVLFFCFFEAHSSFYGLNPRAIFLIHFVQQAIIIIIFFSNEEFMISVGAKKKSFTNVMEIWSIGGNTVKIGLSDNSVNIAKANLAGHFKCFIDLLLMNLSVFVLLMYIQSRTI